MPQTKRSRQRESPNAGTKQRVRTLREADELVRWVAHVEQAENRNDSPWQQGRNHSLAGQGFGFKQGDRDEHQASSDGVKSHFA